MRFWIPLIGLLLAAGMARAEGPAWTPDDGERTEATRAPASFQGMEYLFPLRLHLVRGGHVDGALGGVNLETGELLLVLPSDAFKIELSLIDAVTPLGRLPVAGSPESSLPAPPMLSQTHVEYRLRPTWRSGLGLALSFLLPGAGQWIQEERRELGLIFLGGAAFFVGAGLLALLGPSSYGPVQRRTVGGIMFGLAGTVSIVAGVHAWTAGKRRLAVEVKGARPRPSN